MFKNTYLFYKIIKMDWLRRWVLMKIQLKWHGFLAGKLHTVVINAG
jgi:hypothetical protein